MNLLYKSVILILVYNTALANNRTLLESEVTNLKKLCKYKLKSFFNSFGNSSSHHLLGKGAFGKVYALENSKAIKIMNKTYYTNEPINAEQENLAINSSLRGISNFYNEIAIQKLISEKKSKLSKLGIKSIEENSLYLLSVNECYINMKSMNDIPNEVVIGLETERLAMELNTYFDRNKKLNFLHLLEIFRKILAGLYQLHQLGYAHLDIKPANIMMRTPFDPVIIDFGLSIKIQDKPTTSLSSLADYSKRFDKLVGTPKYLDPLVFDKSIYSFKTDMYAVGIMIFIYFDPIINFEDFIKNLKMVKSVSKFINEKAPKNDNLKYLFKIDDLRTNLLMPLIRRLITDDLKSRAYLKDAKDLLDKAEEEYYKLCKAKTKPQNLVCMDKKEYADYKTAETLKFKKTHNLKVIRIL